MSLIVGQYYRGDPKQKPKQWGTASAVRSRVYDIYNNTFGTTKLKLFFPFWGPGNFTNYADGMYTTTQSGVSYERNKALLDGTNDYIQVSDGSNLVFGTDDFTILWSETPLLSTDLDNVRFSKGGVSTTGNLYIYESHYTFRVRINALDVSRNEVDIDFNTESHCALQRSGNFLNFYKNGALLVSKDVLSGVNISETSDLYLGVDGATNSRYYDGYFGYFVLFLSALTADQINQFYENPYAAIQPPTFRTYFDLAESGLISGAISDGFHLSDSVGKRAIFSAMAQENMSLADMDQNLGNFIAALVDHIEISESTGRTAILNVSSNDSFRFSGAVSSIQKILALIGDDVNISETLSVRSDMAANVQDAIEFSESFVATLQAIAVVNEIINLSDTVSTDALSIITALAADVFSASDGANARADFVSAVLQNFVLSEGATNFLSAIAASSETINISDSAFWQGIQSAFAADDITVTSTAGSLMTALANAAESIQIDDSGAVTATFDVAVNDVLQFAETISAIATLRGSLSDGIRITATPLEISTLPNSKVSISFSLKIPGADFSMKTTTIVFNLK